MKATQSTFWGLEITKTSKGFEVKNSPDLVESLLNLYGLENSKPRANPGRRSVMELPSATLWMVMIIPTFAQLSEKLIFMARAKWIKKVCWNSLVAVTQIGPAIRQHAKVQRDVIAMHRTGHCVTGV